MQFSSNHKNINEVCISSLLQERHVCVLNLQSNSIVPSYSSASTGLRTESQIVCWYLKTLWPEEKSGTYPYQHSFILVLVISKVLMLTSKSSGKVRQTQHFSVLAFLIFCFILCFHTGIFVTISVIYWPAGVFWVVFFLLWFLKVYFLSSPFHSVPCTVTTVTALPCGGSPKKLRKYFTVEFSTESPLLPCATS